jgi:hypothetical protein
LSCYVVTILNLESRQSARVTLQVATKTPPCSNLGQNPHGYTPCLVLAISAADVKWTDVPDAVAPSPEYPEP